MKQNHFPNPKATAIQQISLGLGLIVALSFVLVAFEWSSASPAQKLYAQGAQPVEVIEIDLTVRAPEPPKPLIEEMPVMAPEEIVVKDEKVESPPLFNTEDSPVTAQVIHGSIPEPPRGRAEEADETIVVIADIAPYFSGGENALMAFLRESVKYPEIDIEQGNQGRVVCTFVVEKDGSISDIKVLRGVSPSLDKEALRVISSMPDWNPGIKDGKLVRVKFTLPIYFKLKR